MFSKFDEEAQKVMIEAKKEMQSLKHPYVGSEHLMLAILKEDNEVSKKLKTFGINYKNFKTQIIEIIGIGSKESDYFLYTPLLKRVLESAVIDAREMNDGIVGISNLFYSILEEGEGVAIRIMLGMNVDMDKIYSFFSKKIIKKNNSKKKLLLDKQMARFYRKKIESYVSELLRDKSLIMASDIPINNRKDFENLIYIRLFAIESLVYRVEKTEQRVKTDKCEFTDFEIIRKQTGDKNV